MAQFPNQAVMQIVRLSTAEAYCRKHFGSLASITSEKERQEAMKVTGQNYFEAWIGLNRTAPHANIWQWSDETQSTFTKWSRGEPNDWPPGEACVFMTETSWNDVSCEGQFSTICSRKFMMVKEKKTWEEALNQCRSHYSDLVFVDSQTQLDLLKIETEQAQTASVWTGLRFHDGQWFWVNGMSLGSLVSLPTCPVRSYRCGAYNFNTNVWENRDCNDKLNFLCY
ncbi:C-type mannose receptor 2-like [Silurus asotus]|uniref:C-type mannose receptor 2-like n=1 Tax=Silurus asotus TaxID=30991 RepID=A0AAD5B7L1_SILAS|nr:C-type mannose receptor 2-like [Silurus asotus]